MDNFGDNIRVYHMGAGEFNPEDTSSWMGERARQAIEDGTDPEDVGVELEGWYWDYCIPGCMPDSDEHGPFDTEEKAWKDAARDWLEGRDKLPITLSDSDDAEMDEEGRGWWCKATAYTNRFLAMHDQTIDGCRWETPFDMTDGYAVLVYTCTKEEYDEDGGAEAFNRLIERLKADGYDVTED